MATLKADGKRSYRIDDDLICTLAEISTMQSFAQGKPITTTSVIESALREYIDRHKHETIDIMEQCKEILKKHNMI